jgi:hypothetical protein
MPTNFFIDRETEQELDERQFRRVNINRASFGDVLDAQVAGSLGYDFLVEEDAPTNFDSSTHKAIKQARTFVSPGVYSRGWDVQPLTDADLDARQEAYAATLAQAKASRRSEMTAARARANSTYFEFAGKQIACDDLSNKDIDKVAWYVARHNAFPPNFPGVWKAMDNSYVSLPDVAAWDSFMAAMIAQGTANFVRSEERKQAIAAATTVAQVNAVVW